MKTILTTPNSCSNRAVRPADRPEPASLIASEVPLRFLTTHLLEREPIDPIYMPTKRVLLLYGRKGAGKATMLHVRDPKTGERAFLGGGAFAEVRDFKIRPFNGCDFVLWARQCIALLERMESNPDYVDRGVQDPLGPSSLLIYIADVHVLNALRSGEELAALLHLLTVVQCGLRRRNDVRVIMTCNDSPGRFTEDIKSRIDLNCLMPLPSPEERTQFMLERIEQFRDHAATAPHLAALKWDLALDEESLADPTHIIHTLVIAGDGTTPRDMAEYLSRSFVGCCRPVEGGDTVYDAGWLEALVLSLEGGVKSLTSFNTLLKNTPLLQYAGLLREDERYTSVKKAFIREVANDDEEGGEPAQKRSRPAIVQPPTVTDAITARLEAQRKVLEEAAKRHHRQAALNGIHNPNGM